MRQEQAKKLLKKYVENKATEGEKALLEAWYSQFEIKELPKPGELLKQSHLERIRLAILQHAEINEIAKTIRLWPRIVAAASILIFLSIGGYFLLNKQSDQQLVKIKMHDIAPGSNKAILTLANGKQIILNDAQNGKLVQQGNAAITKTQNGQIVYQAADKGAATDIAYNTTTTPRGGEYHITLADGTNVWLNAASSITYPTTFNGNDRTVQITGEVYFEVAHNAAKPFRVKAAGQLVEDIGTSFNISAYSDETAVKTTLLEGIVKVNGLILKPGQQSDGKSIQSVDTEEIIAWKNGNFRFDNADVTTVMKQLARWYDVNIQCEGNVSDVHYTGLVPRRSDILAVLKMLNETGGTDCKLEGKTIIITK